MTTPDSESVEVAVTVIQYGPDLLAGFNPKWAAFTLPMTKRRVWPAPDDASQIRWEPWQVSATRNVDEWIDVPGENVLEHLWEVSGYRQSDRDLVVKDYHFQIYGVRFRDEPLLRAGALAEWLRPEEFLEVHRRPVSPTTRFLVQALLDDGKLS